MDNSVAKTSGKELTAKEEQLLATLRNDAVSMLPVTKICDVAGIDTSTYYRAFKKEHFVRRVHDECVGLIHSSIIPILHTARAQAVLGDKNAHHWAKMLLEMSGLYVPKREAQVKAEIKLVFNVPRPEGIDGAVIDITSEESSGH